MPPWYCASIGQTGMQLLLPQQAGRPSKLRLLRAVQSSSTLKAGARRSVMRCWKNEAGTLSIGNGCLRGEPVSGEPPVPVITSAS